jgi:hypothetical protein
MDCAMCLRPPRVGALQSIKGMQVCRPCAERIAVVDRAAAIPLVVATFSAYLSEKSQARPNEPCSHEAAQRFWAELTCFGDVVQSIDVLGVLEELAAHAPPRAQPVTDSSDRDEAPTAL